MTKDVDPPGEVFCKSLWGVLWCERGIMEKTHQFFKAHEVGVALRYNVTSIKECAI